MNSSTVDLAFRCEAGHASDRVTSEGLCESCGASGLWQSREDIEAAEAADREVTAAFKRLYLRKIGESHWSYPVWCVLTMSLVIGGARGWNWMVNASIVVLAALGVAEAVRFVQWLRRRTS